MTSPDNFALAAAPGERFNISLLRAGVKLGSSGMPFCMSCDAGVDVLVPVSNTFLGFGLKHHHCENNLLCTLNCKHSMQITATYYYMFINVSTHLISTQSHVFTKSKAIRTFYTMITLWKLLKMSPANDITNINSHLICILCLDNRALKYGCGSSFWC